MSDATNHDPTDMLDDPALSKSTATNDAVAGGPVIESDVYGGPTGAEPREAEPSARDNELQTDDIDLDDTVDYTP